MDNIEGDIPSTEAEADSLLSSIEQPEQGIADRQPETPTQAPWAPPSGEFPVKIGGKDLNTTWDKYSKWAEMGYDAPNKIGSLNKKIAEFESRQKEYDTKYGEIDSYVRQNPQFWQHVIDAYQKRDAMMNDPSNPLAQTVQQLQQQLSELNNFKSSFEQQQNEMRMKREDEEYVGEVSKLKESYPDIDFDTPDDDGKSLEYKVLEYATQNGIKKFTTAFRDFYHDSLMSRNASVAKENLVKNKVENTKRGIIGKTPTPTKAVFEYSKNKSYNQLADEALDEIRSGKWG